MKIISLVIFCALFGLALSHVQSQNDQHKKKAVKQTEPAPGPEPQPGEVLEDEPASQGALSVGQEPGAEEPQQQGTEEPTETAQQESPPSDLTEGGALSFGADELNESQFDADQRCVFCPRFVGRCPCRFLSDCRYIPRSCFSCGGWTCIPRRRFGRFDDFEFDRFGRRRFGRFPGRFPFPRRDFPRGGGGFPRGGGRGPRSFE